MSSQSKVHIMIDLETLDILPTATITQIGVCAFNSKEILGSLDLHIDSFSQACATVSKATLKWREAHPQPAWHGPTYLIDEALRLLEDYLHSFTFKSIWCYGASFDFPILKLAYHWTNMTAPWHYRQERCLRTLLDIKGIAPISGAIHDAIEDSIEQASLMINHKLLGENPHATNNPSTDSSSMGNN